MITEQDIEAGKKMLKFSKRLLLNGRWCYLEINDKDEVWLDAEKQFTEDAAEFHQRITGIKAAEDEDEDEEEAPPTSRARPAVNVSPSDRAEWLRRAQRQGQGLNPIQTIALLEDVETLYRFIQPLDKIALNPSASRVRPAANNCKKSAYSSRTCEKGTHSCTVRHGSSAEKVAGTSVGLALHKDIERIHSEGALPRTIVMTEACWRRWYRELYPGTVDPVVKAAGVPSGHFNAIPVHVISQAVLGLYSAEAVGIGTLERIEREWFFIAQDDLHQTDYRETDKTEGLFIIKVLAHRKKQDSKYGGPEHDDKHTPDDWVKLIQSEALRGSVSCGGHPFRDAMVRVGALALAAVESQCRLEKKASNK